jgi:hypothetical protein
MARHVYEGEGGELDGLTPLQLATLGGYEETIRLLVELGADVGKVSAVHLQSAHDLAKSEACVSLISEFEGDDNDDIVVDDDDTAEENEKFSLDGRIRWSGSSVANEVQLAPLRQPLPPSVRSALEKYLQLLRTPRYWHGFEQADSKMEDVYYSRQVNYTVDLFIEQSDAGTLHLSRSEMQHVLSIFRQCSLSGEGDTASEVIANILCSGKEMAVELLLDDALHTGRARGCYVDLAASCVVSDHERRTSKRGVLHDKDVVAEPKRWVTETLVKNICEVIVSLLRDGTSGPDTQASFYSTLSSMCSDRR